MIASRQGSGALRPGSDSAVVEVGGVGLLVHTTPGTAAGLRRGAEARLATTMVVREESLTLYGFADEDERAVFEQVQTVSGVGPRLALAMLAVHAPDALRQAVSTGDLAALTKVPGIGKKGAERIVLELRDKIGLPTGAAAGAPVAAARPRRLARAGPRGAGRARLVGQAGRRRRRRRVAPEAGDGSDVSGLLRAALRELGR